MKRTFQLIALILLTLLVACDSGTGSVATSTSCGSTLTWQPVGVPVAAEQLEDVSRLRERFTLVQLKEVQLNIAADRKLRVNLCQQPDAQLRLQLPELFHPGLFTGVDSGGQQLNIGDRAANQPTIFSSSDVDTSTVKLTQADNGSTSISFKLKGAAVQQLSTYTAAHINQNLPLALDGVIVNLPIITQAVKDGQVAVNYDSPRANPSILYAQLKSGPLKSDYNLEGTNSPL